MYRLSLKAFDKVFNAIEADLMPKELTAMYFVPPLPPTLMIKLCIVLHFLAVGSYLDISFGYDVPHYTVHFMYGKHWMELIIPGILFWTTLKLQSMLQLLN
jgi:hypothetical protein